MAAPRWLTSDSRVFQLRSGQFEGGQPMALSPDGRTVATIAYSGQTVLWNVADPRHPVKMTTLSDGDGTKLEELAFSPTARS